MVDAEQPKITFSPDQFYAPHTIPEWRSPQGDTIRFGGMAYQKIYQVIEERVRQDEQDRVTACLV